MTAKRPDWFALIKGWNEKRLTGREFNRWNRSEPPCGLPLRRVKTRLRLFTRILKIAPRLPQPLGRKIIFKSRPTPVDFVGFFASEYFLKKLSASARTSHPQRESIPAWDGFKGFVVDWQSDLRVSTAQRRVRSSQRPFQARVLQIFRFAIAIGLKPQSVFVPLV